MPFSIDQVVPWGRTLDEYEAMFSLSPQDKAGCILGCADGPASFNAEMTAQGCRVVSVDPLYALTPEAIAQQGREAFDLMLEQARCNRQDFVWDRISSPEALGQLRMKAQHLFLEDFPCGKAEGRYIDASLPDLPFSDGTFDLALCSHFLFLYSQQFDLEFHVRAMQEMLRVAREVRVFPLLQLGGAPSPHVSGVVAGARGGGRVGGVGVGIEQLMGEGEQIGRG
ncbi:MAG: methyltransferase domain-containing protein, partial [Caldilineaceae bacterium SB0665_bin_21]|nr:methyltransferase domain-containing protein [Caldilineaceae bacterium SB0665_bin_21]